MFQNVHLWYKLPPRGCDLPESSVKILSVKGPIEQDLMAKEIWHSDLRATPKIYASYIFSSQQNNQLNISIHAYKSTHTCEHKI